MAALQSHPPPEPTSAEDRLAAARKEESHDWDGQVDERAGDGPLCCGPDSALVVASPARAGSPLLFLAVRWSLSLEGVGGVAQPILLHTGSQVSFITQRKLQEWGLGRAERLPAHPPKRIQGAAGGRIETCGRVRVWAWTANQATPTQLRFWIIKENLPMPALLGVDQWGHFDPPLAVTPDGVWRGGCNITWRGPTQARQNPAQPLAAAMTDADWLHHMMDLSRHTGDFPEWADASALELPKPPEKEEEFRLLVQSTLGPRENSVLKPGQRRQLEKLLMDHRAAFDSRLRPAGAAHVTPLVVAMAPGRKPPRVHGRTLSKKKATMARPVIRQWIQDGVVTEAPESTPWTLNLVVVPKKPVDGKPPEGRPCLDVSPVNPLFLPNDYPLPNLMEVVDWAAQHEFVTTIDLLSGFLQLPLAEEAHPMMAFYFEGIKYMFKVVPFGLKTAPGHFQNVMATICRQFMEEGWCRIYIDDVIVAHDNFAGHKRDLGRLFQCLQKYNLVAKLAKVSVCKRESTVLGVNVGSGAITMAHDKRDAIAATARPKSKPALRAFLGLANWISPFVKGFACIAGPLYDLGKPAARMAQWSAEHTRAFEQLKEAVLRAPAQRAPDPDVPFHLFTDASDFGFGAALCQRESDTAPFHVVRYASRKLSSNKERNASAFEREAGALVWAVTKFKAYLLPRRFTVHTDHQSLRYIRHQYDLGNRKVARWLYLLSAYEFDIIHVRGVDNGAADGLSRLALGDGEAELVLAVGALWATTEAQTNDAELTSVITQPRHQWPKVFKDTKACVKQGQLVLPPLPDGNLGVDRPVVPVSERLDVMAAFHDDAGHFSFQKAWPQLRARYWWPGMRKEFCVYCRECVRCDQATVRGYARADQQRPMPQTEGRWSTLFADFAGPLIDADDGPYRHALVVTDWTTKYIHVTPTRRARGCDVVKALDNLFSTFGVPERIRCDNASNLNSRAVREAVEAWGGTLDPVLPYNVDAMGAGERAVGIFGKALKLHARSHAGDWHVNVAKFVYDYNASLHTSTGLAPFYAMFGREPRRPGDAPADVQTHDEGHERAAQKLEQGLVRAAARHQEEARRANLRRKEAPLKVGSFVWIKENDKPRSAVLKKAAMPQRGPFEVVATVPARNQVLVAPIRSRGAHEPAVPADAFPVARKLVRPVRSKRTKAQWMVWVDPTEGDQGRSIIESVEEHRDDPRTGELWFAVKFEGKTFNVKDESCWYPHDWLDDCTQAVRDYWSRSLRMQGQDPVTKGQRTRRGWNSTLKKSAPNAQPDPRTANQRSRPSQQANQGRRHAKEDTLTGPKLWSAEAHLSRAQREAIQLAVATVSGITGRRGSDVGQRQARHVIRAPTLLPVAFQEYQRIWQARTAGYAGQAMAINERTFVWAVAILCQPPKVCLAMFRHSR